MMLTFYQGGRLRRARLEPLRSIPPLKTAPMDARAAHRFHHAPEIKASLLRAPGLARADRYLIEHSHRAMSIRGVALWPTGVILAEGLTRAALTSLRSRFGCRLEEVSRTHRQLLRLPHAEPKDLPHLFAAARACVERHGARYAHPNFIKALPRTLPSSSRSAEQWNLYNDGTLGLRGADVDARPAWSLTQGEPRIRVAVIDEGVDAAHPTLAGAVVAEFDAAEHNPTAMPNATDSHGTSCASVIASRTLRLQGLAPQISLVAVRIAYKAPDSPYWVYEDRAAAEGLDWAWQSGRADVLSNSWTDPTGSDALTASITRAQTRGRGGRGTVVIFSTGNEGGGVSYPATLVNVLAVGASNPWDEVKTMGSRDAEPWGTNTGPELDLVAPGVKIRAAVNRNSPVLEASGPYTDRFNGTSAATPHVAAAAALLLSINPALKESAVRRTLCQTAHRLSGPNRALAGSGRLDVFAALKSQALTRHSRRTKPKHPTGRIP